MEQAEFHDEVMDTLSFVVNQSDFTVQILRNVTDFLSSAKTVNVEEVYLPPDAQNEIDKLNTNLDDAANALSEKTDQNSGKIKGGIDFVYAFTTFLLLLWSVFLILIFHASFSLFLGIAHWSV